MRIKLIRDRVKTDRPGDSVRPVNSGPGRVALLVNKMYEEAGEIAADPTDPVEYGDLLEAMMELARVSGVSWEAVEEARLDKEKRLGGFRRGLVLINVNDGATPVPVD